MSIKQINAQIKIQEIWKALNIQDYPIKIVKQTVKDAVITIMQIMLRDKASNTALS